MTSFITEKCFIDLDNGSGGVKINTESDDDSFSRCTYITSMTADEWYSNSRYCYWPQRRTIPMSLTYTWRPLSQNRTDCSIKPAVNQHQHMSSWFRTTIGIITQPRWHESPMSSAQFVWSQCGFQAAVCIIAWSISRLYTTLADLGIVNSNLTQLLFT